MAEGWYDLCISFLQVNFGRDFEQQLSFFVQARANFSNIDSVLVVLVQVSLPYIICEDFSQD